MSHVSCCTIYPLSPISDFSVFFPDVPISFQDFPQTSLYLRRICLYLPVSIQNLPSRISCISHGSSNFFHGCSSIPAGPLKSVLPVFSVDLLLSSMDLQSRILLYFSQTSLFSSPIFLYLSYFAVLLLDLPLFPGPPSTHLPSLIFLYLPGIL
jgi:hypothetical protein